MKLHPAPPCSNQVHRPWNVPFDSPSTPLRVNVQGTRSGYVQVVERSRNDLL
ncbi:hypothetical protein [Lentimicrobium saccharophilum]|uniref:hypothetical protein n=1 Tax=Lentimicrobium saccharophilum TaxID=1678841 RepID=UPI0012B54893|nr:hypothetical protein [Lentimicrobium saccharophilum]